MSEEEVVTMSKSELDMRDSMTRIATIQAVYDERFNEKNKQDEVKFDQCFTLVRNLAVEMAKVPEQMLVCRHDLEEEIKEDFATKKDLQIIWWKIVLPLGGIQVASVAVLKFIFGGGN